MVQRTKIRTNVQVQNSEVYYDTSGEILSNVGVDPFTAGELGDGYSLQDDLNIIRVMLKDIKDSANWYDEVTDGYSLFELGSIIGAGQDSFEFDSLNYLVDGYTVKQALEALDAAVAAGGGTTFASGVGTTVVGAAGGQVSYDVDVVSGELSTTGDVVGIAEAFSKLDFTSFAAQSSGGFDFTGDGYFRNAFEVDGLTKLDGGVEVLTRLKFAVAPTAGHFLKTDDSGNASWAQITDNDVETSWNGTNYLDGYLTVESTFDKIDEVLKIQSDSLQAHINNTLDAHDASAISFVPGSLIVATGDDVQEAIEQIDGYIAATRTTVVNTSFTGGAALQINSLDTAQGLGSALTFDVQVDSATIEVNGSDQLQVKADGINDTHINWGTGANQVSAEDMPIADVDGYFSTDNVEAALRELSIEVIDHLADSVDAHDASAISFSDANSAGEILAGVTEVQAALDLLGDGYESLLALVGAGAVDLVSTNGSITIDHVGSTYDIETEAAIIPVTNADGYWDHITDGYNVQNVLESIQVEMDTMQGTLGSAMDGDGSALGFVGELVQNVFTFTDAIELLDGYLTKFTGVDQSSEYPVFSGEAEFVNANVGLTSLKALGDASSLVVGLSAVNDDLVEHASYVGTGTPDSINPHGLAALDLDGYTSQVAGSTGSIGDQLAAIEVALNNLQTFAGSAGDSDSSPVYASVNYIEDGYSLEQAISTLDAALNAFTGSVTLQQAYDNDPTANPDLTLADNEVFDILLGAPSSSFKVSAEDGSPNMELTNDYFKVWAAGTPAPTFMVADGYVWIDGYLSITGSTLQVNTVVTDADHWLVSPLSSATPAVQIKPESAFANDYISIENSAGVVYFEIDQNGDGYFSQDLVVEGMLDVNGGAEISTSLKYDVAPTGGHFLKTDASGNASWAQVMASDVDTSWTGTNYLDGYLTAESTFGKIDEVLEILNSTLDAITVVSGANDGISIVESPTGTFTVSANVAGALEIESDNIQINLDTNGSVFVNASNELEVDAAGIDFIDADYAATNVSAALSEVMDELNSHLDDTEDAHDASAISFVPGSLIVATGDDVQEVIGQIDGYIAATRTTVVNTSFTGGAALQINSLDTAQGLGSALTFDVQVDNATIEVNGSDQLQVKADGINDLHIDWGFGLNQVSSADMPTLAWDNVDGYLSDHDGYVENALQTLADGYESLLALVGAGAIDLVSSDLSIAIVHSGSEYDITTEAAIIPVDNTSNGSFDRWEHVVDGYNVQNILEAIQDELDLTQGALGAAVSGDGYFNPTAFVGYELLDDASTITQGLIRLHDGYDFVMDTTFASAALPIVVSGGIGGAVTVGINLSSDFIVNGSDDLAINWSSVEVNADDVVFSSTENLTTVAASATTVEEALELLEDGYDSLLAANNALGISAGIGLSETGSLAAGDLEFRIAQAFAVTDFSNVTMMSDGYVDIEAVGAVSISAGTTLDLASDGYMTFNDVKLATAVPLAYSDSDWNDAIKAIAAGSSLADIGIVDAINAAASAGGTVEKAVYIVASTTDEITLASPTRGSIELTSNFVAIDFVVGRDVEVYVNGLLLLIDNGFNDIPVDDCSLISTRDKIKFTFNLVAGDVVIVKNLKAMPGEDVSW